MAVIPSITAAAKKFAGKPMGVASKALGVATIASVLYDSHVNGKERAYSHHSVTSADRFYNQYKQFMTSEKQSATVCKLKKWWFEVQQDFTFLNVTDKIGGYATGFGQTIGRCLPLLGLSAVALKFNKAGKIAGALLALSGLKTLFSDVIGFNNKSTPKL